MENEEFAYIPCTCPCHGDPNMTHCFPCCHDGLVAVRKNEVKDADMIEQVFGHHFGIHIKDPKKDY